MSEERRLSASAPEEACHAWPSRRRPQCTRVRSFDSRALRVVLIHPHRVIDASDSPPRTTRIWCIISPPCLRARKGGWEIGITRSSWCSYVPRPPSLFPVHPFSSLFRWGIGCRAGIQVSRIRVGTTSYLALVARTIQKESRHVRRDDCRKGS